MVVTRKPSLPVPGSVSRTPSSTSSPKSKGKGSQEPAPSPLSQSASRNDESNGEAKATSAASSSESNKSESSSKTKSKTCSTTKQRRSWLFWLILILSSVYTFNTCRRDYLLDNPVCNGLHVYRTKALEPALRAVARHPSVAPHLLRLEPVAYQTWETYQKTVERTAPYVNYMKQRVSRMVSPLWTRVVEPRIQLVQLKLNPYRKAAMEKYKLMVDPYVVQVQDQVSTILLSVNPYGRQFVEASQNGFRICQPYFYSGLDTAQMASGYAYETIYLPIMTSRRQYIDPLLINVYGRTLFVLTEYRAAYIDPHIAKLTSRVRQLGEGVTEPESPAPSPTSFYPPEPSIVDEETAPAEPEPTPYAENSADRPAAVTTDVPNGIWEPDSVSPSVPEAPVEVAGETAISEDTVSESRVTQETVETTPPETATSEGVPAETAPPSPEQEEAATIVGTPIPNFPTTETETEAPDISSVASGTATQHLKDEGDDDDTEFQALLKEIESESDFEPKPVDDAPGPAEEPSPVTPHASPEEKAAEIDRKRADITERHELWERKLSETTVELNTSFFKALRRQRVTAVNFLKSADGDPFKMASLQSEAEKAVRNTENYLTSLHADGKRNTVEKERLWEKVTGRVEEKFYDRVRQIEEQVDTWMKNTTELEVTLVRESYLKLKVLGGDAQADIGMDYAWLDDVTYHDWQRYHALLDVADTNGKYWQSIQDGSHPNAPVNKPVILLMESQNELQDIVEGFDNRLTQVTRNGYRTLGGDNDSEAQPEPEPEVSILPIPPQEHSDESGDIADALLSRYAEEVASALGRVNQAIEDEGSDLAQSKEEIIETSQEAPTSEPAPIADSSRNKEPSPSVPQETQPIENVGDVLSREQAKIDHTSKSQSDAESILSSKANASSITDSEPTVSILPIEEPETDFTEAAQGILQRGKEEVEEAFGRADENQGE